MRRIEFGEGMFRHFCIKDAGRFIDQTLLMATGQCTLDVIAFDDYLHAKYGDYEERGLSMSEVIREKFGLDASLWAERAINPTVDKSPTP